MQKGDAKNNKSCMTSAYLSYEEKLKGDDHRHYYHYHWDHKYACLLSPETAGEDVDQDTSRWFLHELIVSEF